LFPRLGDHKELNEVCIPAQPRAPYVRDLRVHLMEGWECFAKETMTSALNACWAITRLEMSVVGR
jgi:hypothetical protein